MCGVRAIRISLYSFSDNKIDEQPAEKERAKQKKQYTRS